MRKGGGTPAAQFDAWEVDLATGKERRLTFFKFFSMSSLAYFPDDERFIFYGTFPEAYPGIKDRDQAALTRKQIELSKKGMAFAGIQVMRGTEMMPEPYPFADNVLPSNPLLSKDGTRLLFEGKAQQYYLYSPDGNHRLVGGGGSINSAAISPDGGLLAYISVNLTIDIYKVQDGRHQVELFLPVATRIKNWDNDIRKHPRTNKMLPELPLRIISW
jgi:tricorn protease-like protein